MVYYLVFYFLTISSLLYPIIYWIIWVVEFVNSNDDKYQLSNPNLDQYNNYKNYSFINNVARTTIFLLSSLLLCIEKKQLDIEIKKSPLNLVDEFLTEELYQNILNQSKRPENNEYKDKFNQLMEERKISIKSKDDIDNDNEINSKLITSINFLKVGPLLHSKLDSYTANG